MAFGKQGAAEAETSDRAPSQDRLEALRDALREMRDLRMVQAELEERLRLCKARQYALESRELPEAFHELGINALGLEAEGNMPAYDAKLKPYRHLVLPRQDKEKRKVWLAWLRKHKHADVVKTVFKVAVGMGEDKLARELQAALKKRGVDFTVEQDVPWGTLTALYKDLENRKLPLPPPHMTEGMVGTIVQVIQVKSKEEG